MRLSGDLSLQIASTKLLTIARIYIYLIYVLDYCYHSVIKNVIEINRNQSLIVLQKYGSK
jgi:hypothetical protein